jgi:translocation and assembly module TamB
MDRPTPSDAAGTPRRPALLRLWLRLVSAPVVLAGLVVVALLLLDSPFGHRLIADRIAALAPASGLRIEIGRIQGSIYGRAVLRDVALADPQGVFLRAPEVRLDWRPLAWATNELDLREVIVRRASLLRLPRLRPGDPDAPVLPGFDIRLDRLAIERLTVAPGVAGPQARRVDLVARANVHEGRALVSIDGSLGGADRLFALLDTAPDADRFDLKLDYRAPAGGLLAGLTGAKRGLEVQAGGKGSWRNWNGAFAARSEGRPVAALRLRNRAGRFGVLGLAWPGDLLSGVAARAAGESVIVSASGTFVANRLDGTFSLGGTGVTLAGTGGVDLGRNRFEALRLRAAARDGDALLPGVRLEGASLAAELDGPFRDLAVEHRLAVARLTTGGLRLEALEQAGTARYDGARWTLPLEARAARLVSGNAALDPRLAPLQLRGAVTLAGAALASDRLLLSVPGLAAGLTLRGDTARGGYALVGPVAARGLALPDLGLADAEGRIALRFGGAAWALNGTLAGRMARVDNPTLTALAGTGIRFGGQFGIGSSQPLVFSEATLSGSKLALGVAGRALPGGRATLSGRGRQADFGPFTVSAELAGDGPRAVLTFADPLPAAGLKDVRVALAPIAQGFRIETAGESALGPFNGVLGLFAGQGPTRIAVERLEVWKTAVTGAATLGADGISGALNLAGGGVTGRIDLAPRR